MKMRAPYMHKMLICLSDRQDKYPFSFHQFCNTLNCEFGPISTTSKHIAEVIIM